MLSLLSSFVSCKEVNEDSLMPYGDYCFLDISEEDLTFEYDPSVDGCYDEKEIEVTSRNVAWEFSGCPEWLTFTPDRGSGSEVVTVRVKNYSDFENDRKTTVRFISADGPISFRKHLNIFQEHPEMYNIFSEDEFYVDCKEQTIDLFVETNNPDCTLESLAEWVEVDWFSHEDDDCYHASISVMENTGAEERDAVLLYRAGSYEKRISVHQGLDRTVTFTPEELEFASDGGSLELSFKAHSAWRIETYPEWVTLSAARGYSGENTIAVSVEENASTESRTGVISYVDADNRIDIPCVQLGCGATAVSPKSLNFGSEGGELTFELKTIYDWTIAEDFPSWLDLSAVSGGPGTYTVTVTAEANDEPSERTHVLFYVDASGLIEISVTQEPGTSINITPTLFTFSSEGGSAELYIDTPNYWEITDVPEWIYLSQTSGYGYSVVALMVAEHYSATKRTAFLTYREGEIEMEITVEQNGMGETTLSPRSFEYTSGGATKVLNLYANSDWAITEIPEWMNVSPSSGTAGIYTLNVSVSANKSYDRRSAVLKYADQNTEADINVTQSGVKRTTISPESLSFSYEEGTKTIEITTETDWTITEWPEWVTLSKTTSVDSWYSSPYDIDVTVTENTTSEARSGNIVYTDYNETSRIIEVVQEANPNRITSVEGTHVSIELVNAGKLQEILGDGYMSSTTEITIVGNMNFRDFITLREMIESYSLEALNMTGAVVVEGEDYLTQENVFPGLFSNLERLKSVKLPDSITKIEGGAFSRCTGLESVDLGTGVRFIGSNDENNWEEGAFSYCTGLKEIIIPGSVEEIGYQSFYGCTELRTLSVGAGRIGDYAFQDCSKLYSLELLEGVEEIGEYAFVCPALSGELLLPGTLKKIGGHAFTGCNRLAGDLIIPDSVTSIGKYAFSDCSGFVSLYLGDSLETIGEGAFEDCSGFLGGLAFGENVRTIGDKAFHNCRGMTGDLIISDSVTSIGYYSFRYTAFTGLTLGRSVETIGNYAFEFVPLEGELVIPDSVKSIGYGTFENCSQLTSLTLGYNLASIGDGAFRDCRNITSLYIDSKEIPYYSGCNELFRQITDFTIGSRTEAVSDGCFRDCTNLKGELVLPDCIRSIGEYAFSGCTEITSLKLSANTERIGYAAFENCSGIQGIIDIPDTVTEIFGNAFDGCSGFSSLIVGDGLTSMEANLFRNCSSLTAANLGRNLTTLKSSVFQNCSSLSSVTLNAEVPPTYGSYCWSGIASPATLYVPASGVEAYQAAGWGGVFDIVSIIE